MVFHLKQADDSVEVRRDGTIVAREGWAVATPVDPGPHTITVSAPRRRPWTTTVVSKPSTTDDVEVPELEKDEAKNGSGIGGMTPGFQRTLGIVGVAVGIAAVASGTTLAFVADSDGAVTVSRLSLVGGAIMLGGGLVLYFTAPSGPSSSSTAAMVGVVARW